MSDAPKKWTEIVPSLPVRAYFAALCALTGLAGLQLFRNIPLAESASEGTRQSVNAVLAIHAIDEAVQDAERGQRGFVITGRSAYLDPYLRAKERLPQLMVELIKRQAPARRRIISPYCCGNLRGGHHHQIE